MSRTESQGSEAALIAPGEIRELVARLTEQSVESIPVGVARTLEGVSLETGIPIARLRETLAQMRREGRFVVPPAAWVGFVALAAFGVWAVRHTPGEETVVPAAPPIAKPIAVEPDLGGTVSLTQVTYGPDAGDFLVNPNFEPTKPLPEGVSVYAAFGKLLWGSGDHRARALDRPLSPEEADAVRLTVEELLRYIRQDAARRHLSLPPDGIPVTSNTYSGSGSARAALPPPGASNDGAADVAAKKAARDLVQSLQDQLGWLRNIRREQGP